MRMCPFGKPSVKKIFEFFWFSAMKIPASIHVEMFWMEKFSNRCFFRPKLAFSQSMIVFAHLLPLGNRRERAIDRTMWNHRESTWEVPPTNGCNHSIPPLIHFPSHLLNSIVDCLQIRERKKMSQWILSLLFKWSRTIRSQWIGYNKSTRSSSYSDPNWCLWCIVMRAWTCAYS